MSVAVKVVLGFVAAIVVVVGLMFVSGTISILTAPFRGEVAKNERVEASGDYRIAAYDEFKTLCAGIQSKNDQITVLEQEMQVTEDDARRAQLQSGITANRNSKAQLVNEYNAKATSDYTKGQFRDSDLPYQIGVDEENISCGS